MAIALVLTAAAYFSAAYPASAVAKEYSIADVVIRAQTHADGSMVVTEERSFDFDGSFSEVHWRFETGGAQQYEIIGVKQTEPVARDLVRTDDSFALDQRPEGAYLVRDSGGAVEVYAFHRTEDDRATFVLQYRVRGAVQRFSDTAELYWKAVGEGWGVRTDRVSVTIEPPASLTKQQVRAWAHGPLTGNVAIAENGVVTLDVSNVPAETFIEARVLYPPEAVAQAPLIDRPRESEVLEEEGRLAEEANRQRSQARLVTGAAVGGSWIVSLGALVLGIWAFFRHGREHKPEFVGQYYREDPRPDLHPAVIGALWRFGRVEDVDIAATLMDLADKGVLHMQPVEMEKQGIGGLFGGTEQTYQLTRVPGTEAKQTRLDRQLLTLLFSTVGGGSDTLLLSELPKYAKKHAETFSAKVKEWKDAASAEAEQLGFFDSASRGWQIGTFMVAGFTVAVGFAGLVISGSPLGLVAAVPVAVVLAILGVFMNRRSQEGNELYNMYAAVRNFLKDFSRLNEVPPASVVLWNRFLVLAVIFGIAEEVIEQLRVVLPDVVSNPGFQTSYWWVYAGGPGRVSPVSAVSRSFVSASQVASSQMSSASGGGGGFSGGGGGGFGGGGGGAS